ncbi:MULTISPECIES: lytic murein transglycosylase [Pacificibacter]|uniref:lytic murein transglycosylase n=1 Tax=Pacificibacter TaxID=1042323 RepID=UPI001C08BBC9|nr:MULTISPECIES: lytic murein transglycosylase [Pacificibacter]MBU2937325.1 lytic murein transglycosylase [Pacificibacter marinus]MDO6615320.1 lytic murein transglycosylase [Pacificibacter sp. 1_MG-2023]
MRFLPLVLALTCASPALANVPCGGSFSSFVNNAKAEAVRMGHNKSTVNKFFANAAHSPAVIKADRSQGVFKKDFIEFSRAVISQNRMSNGASYGGKYKSVFDKIEQQYGVSRGVLLAFWALETDYGQVQGNFNTLNSLLTLGHDCRRPELFQPQIFAALELYEHGDFDPVRTQGAWAGEIGMVQMLPEDILRNGVDGDGDGHVSLKTSAPDALMSGGKMLKGLGWRAGEPWLQEITVPSNLDWSKTGLNHKISVGDWAKMGVTARTGSLGKSNLKASVLLPMGRKGPAFLAYPNFDVYFEWNKSFVYVTTAAYFATRLEGAPAYKAGNPDAGLSDAQMKNLQTKLKNHGHDVGKVDGILGAKTRAAVQAEQQRLGLPADAWPTTSLLGAL